MNFERYKINFDIENVLPTHLPYLSEFYNSTQELRNDVKDLFSFPLANKEAMPFYTISGIACDDIATVAEDVYGAMINAVDYLFENPVLIPQFYDCEMLRSNEGLAFIDYAQHTFRQKNMLSQALYGRFDMAIDPKTDRVTGVYEFNGDTPVMLFESTALESDFVRQIDITGESQFNEYYERISESLRQHRLGLCDKFAIVFNSDYIEDMATCEILTELLGQHVTAFMVDIKELDYDHAGGSKPFIYSDIVLDGMFVLSPWEEMVTAFPAAFLNWKQWADSVVIMEPSWRWFMSNKGVWALMTCMMSEESRWAHAWKDLPLLKTYMSKEPLLGNPQVSKPSLGRLSSNIEFLGADGEVIVSSEGYYGDTERVYQELCPAGSVRQGKNFIAGVWMAPHCSRNNLYARAGTLCFREFDNEIIETMNERFIPHLVV
jgi:glutathionylspermidine synthase